MNPLEALQAAAYKSELIASRRLASATGVSAEHALRQTLTLKAGAAGLERLLTERAAAAQAETQRLAARTARREAVRLARQTRHEAPPTLWRAWFDGSAKPNPGRCTIGALLCGPHGARIAISRDVGDGNSSEAEYLALIAVLEAALAAGAHDVAVHGDSRVVVDDASGPDHTAAPSLQPYRRRVRALLAQLPGATLRWVPRHKNTVADALSQRTGIDAGIDHSRPAA